MGIWYDYADKILKKERKRKMQEKIKLTNFALAGRLLYVLENSSLNTEEVLDMETDLPEEEEGFDSLEELNAEFFLNRPALSTDIEMLNKLRYLILDLTGLEFKSKIDSESHKEIKELSTRKNGSQLKVEPMMVDIDELDQIVDQITNNLLDPHMSEQEVIDQAIQTFKESDSNA